MNFNKELFKYSNIQDYEKFIKVKFYWHYFRMFIINFLKFDFDEERINTLINLIKKIDLSI